MLFFSVPKCIRTLKQIDFYDKTILSILNNFFLLVFLLDTKKEIKNLCLLYDTLKETTRLEFKESIAR
jgi:hypothetical protein